MRAPPVEADLLGEASANGASAASLVLPLVFARGMADEEADLMAPSSRRARPCILVVDDEDGTRTALALWLSHDYEVVTAADGAAGFETASRLDPPPDVILSDVWMPGVDGLSMLKSIKQHDILRRVPVIFLTGQTSAKSAAAGIAAGARAYLAKPIDLDVLDRKIRGALRGSQPAL
jgi:DNA-binding response OmpR family regulator